MRVAENYRFIITIKIGLKYSQQLNLVAVRAVSVIAAIRVGIEMAFFAIGGSWQIQMAAVKYVAWI